MATSVYFNNYNAKYNEQKLYEDLIVESIKIMGFDGYYLPNDNDQARDLLFGEDPVKKFQSAFPIELYLSSDPMDYIGQKDFFSKFGLEIKDDVNVLLSRRTFQERIPQNSFTRPRKGDLIYVPFLNGTGELFEIKFVEQAKDFNMLGRKQPYFYELMLEKFKYSQEIIDTGVADIDDAITQSGYTLDLNVTYAANNYIQKEVVYQAPDNTHANATAVGTVQSWHPLENTLTLTNVAGEFNPDHLIIGSSSNAQYMLVSYDPLEDNVRDDSSDNFVIENQANNIVDLTEINPFGTI